MTNAHHDSPIPIRLVTVRATASGGSMESRKYRCSINVNLVDKNIKGNKSFLAKGFEPKTLTCEELIGVVSRGRAISFQFKDQHRKTENFLRTDIALVDVDENRSIEDALNDPIVSNHALFIYTTSNHRPDHPRYRIVFGLPRTITDVCEIRALSAALAVRLAGDLHAVDGARVYYGAKGCKIIEIGQELEDSLMEDLIRQGLEHVNKRRLITSEGQIQGLIRSNRYIDPAELIRTASGYTVPIGAITGNISVYCPDHFDRNPSAFVSMSSSSGNMFLRCRVCEVTRWIDRQPIEYNFDGFDQVVREIFEKGDHKEHSETTIFGERVKRTLVGGRIFCTENQKLSLDKLQKGLMFVKSPKGSGKTQSLPELMAPLLSIATKGKLTFEEFEEADEEGVSQIQLSGETNYSILLIGHRRSLIREMSQRLGLECYLDDDPKDDGDRINASQKLFMRQKRYGICLDSLPKLTRSSYDLIIIDESEQVLSHFMSETMSQKREKIFSLFANLVRESQTTICLDADMSWLTFNTICELAPARSKQLSEGELKNIKIETQPNAISKPVFIYLNKFHIDNKTIDLYKNKAHMVEDLIENLHENKKIFVASNSKNQVKELAEAIRVRCPDKKIIQITSDNSTHKDIQAFIANIKYEFPNYDAVITSPSLSTGVDITFSNQAELVDIVYGIFENNITHHFEIDQQISRVRHPKAIKLWISPQTLNYETDIVTIKEGLLAENLYANTRSDFEITEQDNQLKESDKLVTLASMVASRQRASMNHLRANFVKYKKSQGYEFKVIEKEDESSSRGNNLLKTVSNSLDDRKIADLISAQAIDHGTFINLSDNRESTIEITEQMSNSYFKCIIELFFREKISPELVKAALDDQMRKIRWLERLLSLSNNKPRNRIYRLPYRALKEDIENNRAKHESLKNEDVGIALLDLILNHTPIYKGGCFIFDREFCNDDLTNFVQYVKAHEAVVECQLGKVRGDISQKSTTQLGMFLGIIGLSTEKVRKDQTGGKAVYYYKLSRIKYDEKIRVIEKRSLVDSATYRTTYWTEIHRANGFTTPIFEKLIDQIGNTQYTKTYWLPMSNEALEAKFRKADLFKNA